MEVRAPLLGKYLRGEDDRRLLEKKMRAEGRRPGRISPGAVLEGVPFREILARLKPQPEATHVMVLGQAGETRTATHFSSSASPAIRSRSIAVGHGHGHVHVHGRERRCIRRATVLAFRRP
jgi:hypothetical protein